ncbi:hypothetical protein D3C71_1473570 [compost metagenome]
MEESSDLTWAVGPLARFSENTTSLAVSAAPSWNFTFGRSVNSQTVGSSLSFHDVASDGWSRPLASRVTRVSYIWCSREKLVPTLKAWGSSDVGSEARAQRSVSAGAAGVVSRPAATSDGSNSLRSMGVSSAKG